jgi:hypothetical protein
MSFEREYRTKPLIETCERHREGPDVRTDVHNIVARRDERSQHRKFVSGMCAEFDQMSIYEVAWAAMESAVER